MQHTQREECCHTGERPVKVGSGYIDFKAIFAAAKTAGVKHYFVEQDGAPSPVHNLTTSFNNLKKIVE